MTQYENQVARRIKHRELLRQIVRGKAGESEVRRLNKEIFDLARKQVDADRRAGR